jgi:hypothetical protein
MNTSLMLKLENPYALLLFYFKSRRGVRGGEARLVPRRPEKGNKPHYQLLPTSIKISDFSFRLLLSKDLSPSGGCVSRLLLYPVNHIDTKKRANAIGTHYSDSAMGLVGRDL